MHVKILLAVAAYLFVGMVIGVVSTEVSDSEPDMVTTIKIALVWPMIFPIMLGLLISDSIKNAKNKRR